MLLGGCAAVGPDFFGPGRPKLPAEWERHRHRKDPHLANWWKIYGDRNRVNYMKALADIDSAREALNNAKLNLARTKVYAEVDGWVSNINLQVGSQAVANKPILALVDRNTFWVFGFFREDAVSKIVVGDEARVTLMAYPDRPLKGRVESIAWGITPPDGNPGPNLLPKVKPVFQWIRLAQRIPVRIALEELPPEVKLRVGMTASVMILKQSEGRKGRD